MKLLLNHRILGLLAAWVSFIGVSTPIAAQSQVSFGDQEVVAMARPVGALVALTSTGALLRSTDNVASFTTVRGADAQRTFYAVAAWSNVVVAMGDGSSFVRSDDSGATFTDRAVAVSSFIGTIRSLAVSGSNWAAVGDKGGKIVVLFSSNDGVTWTLAPGVPDQLGTLNGVAATGDAQYPWVAVGADISSGFIIKYSTVTETWSSVPTESPLYAVASDGTGTLTAVGDSGSILRGTTSTDFTSINEGIISESLYSVVFLSGGNWVAGGEAASLVTISNSAPTLAVPPSSAPSATPITAIIADGNGNYTFFSPVTVEPPAPHGPISLQIAVVSGELSLTLTGAESGNSYEIESSTTLASWSVVADSARAFAGDTAPTWTYPLPVSGRVFYRARLVNP